MADRLRKPNVWELGSLIIKHEFDDEGYIMITLHINDDPVYVTDNWDSDSPIYIADNWSKLWGFVDACRVLYEQYCGFEVKVSRV